MRVTILMPGIYIRALDGNGADITGHITSSSFGLNANSTTRQIIDQWAQHNWKFVAQCDAGGASMIAVDRPA